MKLAPAFRIARGEIVSFIGAGGKTATLLALGHELAESGWRVLATTSQVIPTEQLDFFPHALPASSSATEINAALDGQRFVFLYGEINNMLANGLPTAKITHLLDSVTSDVLLVEADQARGLPLKAPLEHEPHIPPDTTLVVAVASLSALGAPLDAEHVYNHEAIQSRYGFGEGSEILPVWLAQVMRDETLGLKGIPPQARVVAYLNRYQEKRYLRARRVSHFLLRQKRIESVAFGAARSAEPVFELHRHVGAIVLAAGRARRMGVAKVLLPWHDGQSVIEQIVAVLKQSRLSEINVVLGHASEKVAQLLKPQDIRTIINAQYATGEMLSSLQAGLRALSPHIQAALVVLGDQPRLQPGVIAKLLSHYARNVENCSIVAPAFDGKRGHPLLIDRVHWPELLAMTSGAPRDVINKYASKTRLVSVANDSVITDIDTPQDYAIQRERAGLPPYRLAPKSN